MTLSKKLNLLLILFLLSSCASLNKEKLNPPAELLVKNKVEKIKVEKIKEEKIVIKEEPVKEHSFLLNETIVIDLYYIGLRAATLTLNTMPFVTVDGNKAYHFHGNAKTSELMSLIYKVDNNIDTYVDYKNFIPLKMNLEMNESKQNVSMIINYDHEKKLAEFWKKRIDAKGVVTETKRDDELISFSQDIFSSLYYVRTKVIKPGDKFGFNIYDNAKNWTLNIEVLKRERIWTRLGDVDTLLLKPTVEKNGEKFTKGSMLLWVTDDEKKVPVKFEAEVKIGSMKGIIKDYINRS